MPLLFSVTWTRLLTHLGQLEPRASELHWHAEHSVHLPPTNHQSKEFVLSNEFVLCMFKNCIAVRHNLVVHQSGLHVYIYRCQFKSATTSIEIECINKTHISPWPLAEGTFLAALIMSRALGLVYPSFRRRVCARQCAKIWALINRRSWPLVCSVDLLSCDQDPNQRHCSQHSLHLSMHFRKTFSSIERAPRGKEWIFSLGARMFTSFQLKAENAKLFPHRLKTWRLYRVLK
jgi:hypothetical protein